MICSFNDRVGSYPTNNHHRAAPPYLVANEVPFLLVVILSEETSLVRREVHGALRRGAERQVVWMEFLDCFHGIHSGMHGRTSSFKRKCKQDMGLSRSILVTFSNVLT